MIKIKELIMLIVINLIIFQTPLINVNNVFSYIDEIITIFLGIYYIFKLLQKKLVINKNEFYNILMLIGLLITRIDWKYV